MVLYANTFPLYSSFSRCCRFESTIAIAAQSSSS